MTDTATTETRKSTIDAVIKRLIDFVLSDRFLTVFVGVGSVAWAALWAVLSKSVTIPSWCAALIIALVVALALLAVVQRVRISKAAKALECALRAQERSKRRIFNPIVVHDPKLAIYWNIVTDPEQWIRNHREIQGSGYPHHETLLAGPYHSRSGCAAELKTITVMQGSSPQLMCDCPSCGDKVFRVPSEETTVKVWQVRAQALEELQRLARVGKPIAGVVTLENPSYWNEMLKV